jgi:hypothetical protein
MSSDTALTREMEDDDEPGTFEEGKDLNNSHLPVPLAAPSKGHSETDGAAEAASASATATVTTEESTSRGKRQRKSIQNFNPEEYDTQKKEIEIPSGNGVKLMDMPNVVDNFKAITWSDPHLKMLHSLIFGGRGKKKEFKAHLLQFNGLVYPEGKDAEEERAKLREKMYKLTLPELMSVMDLVDVPRYGSSFGLEKSKAPSKDDLCTRLLEWLEEPGASGNKRKDPPSKKRKSTPSSSNSGSAAKKSSSTKTSPSTQKKKAAAASPKPKVVAKVEKKISSKKPKAEEEVNINIPGVDIDKLREKVRSIVQTGNRDTLSVKSIRAMLEDWLDTDLGGHKDAIRTIVMDEL